MNTFSDSFRVVLWFALCVAMAVGMISFALLYGISTYLLRKIAWSKLNFSLPSIRLAK